MNLIHMRHILSRRRSGARFLGLVAVVTAIAACNSLTETLLEVDDPDIIDPSLVQSTAGANAVRVGALSRLRSMTGGSEGSWLFGGLLADEWGTTSTFIQNDEADQRSISLSNGSVTGSLRLIYRVPTSANQAIALLNKYKPLPASDIGEMYFARGFAQMQLALDFCNGSPLSDAAGTTVILGTPLSNVEVFTIALASFDSALALSAGTDAASVIINRAARIGKARTLIALARPAEAAVLVAGIPTTYTYDVTSSLTGGTNVTWAQGASSRRYSVGDSIEGNSRNLLVQNAIPFFSARDPRVPAVYTVSTNGRDTTKSQDGITFSRTTPRYGQTSSMAVVNGIDARLIEAEAALRASDVPGMMAILNALRATPIVLVAPSPQASGTHPGLTTPVMAALATPGTAAAQVDLLFREKAFWTFGRGHRLGDMRRLIRQYGRTQNQVFPVGAHYRGGNYGTDVNLPVTTDEKNGNPNFSQCTDRNA